MKPRDVSLALVVTLAPALAPAQPEPGLRADAGLLIEAQFRQHI